MQLRTQHTGNKMGTIFPWENLLYASLSPILLQGLSYPDFSVHEHFLCLFVNIIQLESHASVYFCVQLFFFTPSNRLERFGAVVACGCGLPHLLLHRMALCGI